MNTPRTDAETARYGDDFYYAEMVEADFARKLEVESDSRLAVIRRAYELLSKGHRDEAELLLFTNRD